jgi:hypothetical protein
VGRRPRHFRSLVLTLVAVLAWPWSLALAPWDANPARDAAFPTSSGPHPGAGGRLVARVHHRSANERAALPQVDSREAEEGDEICPPVWCFVPALATPEWSPRAAGAQDAADYPSPALPPISHLFPLRC